VAVCKKQREGDNHPPSQVRVRGRQRLRSVTEWLALAESSLSGLSPRIATTDSHFREHLLAVSDPLWLFVADLRNG
jgi:hypothetical protein